MRNDINIALYVGSSNIQIEDEKQLVIRIVRDTVHSLSRIQNITYTSVIYFN